MAWLDLFFSSPFFLGAHRNTFFVHHTISHRAPNHADMRIRLRMTSPTHIRSPQVASCIADGADVEVADNL